jgi:CPA1 family monovalent cation:H+ antiporter
MPLCGILAGPAAGRHGYNPVAMSLFAIFALLITLAAVFGFANERTLRLPAAIGITLGALLFSLVLVLLHHATGLALDDWAESVLGSIDFDELVMEAMLSFLLFAGALHVDLDQLKRNRLPVIILATGGVVLSTFLVGTATWWLLSVLGFELPYAWALLFGALISPTDPIAVLGILKKAGTPERVENLITGESLFNDGVGVVVFAALVDLALGGGELDLGHVGLLFLEEAVGGILFGFVLGLVAYRMLKWIDNYSVEVLITLAVVAGGYALAGALHLSGPLAMVVAGLLLGNHGRSFAMSEKTRKNLDTFWELVDEVLNALLFVLIGFEVLVLDLTWGVVLVGLLAIVVVLTARLTAVGATLNMLRLRKAYQPYTVRVMTWGGLRGGISIALALSLPASPERQLILGMTYVVVVFSILVQGLTVGRLAKRIPRDEEVSPTE